MNELSRWNQLQIYLYSARHFVGSAAALAGLGLHFAGFIDKGWWIIVAGLYAAGALLTPSSDAADRIARAKFTEENLRERMTDLIKMARGRVPAEAGHRLEAIREHTELLLPKLKELTERGALTGSVRHDVLQTLTRYLPDTLVTYFRLPAAYSRFRSDGDGKTPQTLLVEQLRLLEENLGKAVKEAYAEDVTQLEVQGRFLSEKYTPAP